MEPNLMDDIDSGNLFDQIDDLIDFPPDDDCADGNLVSSSECKDFPTWDEALQGCDPLFSGGHAASDYAAELSVPYEDIVQLEWLSNFVEDSFSDEGLTLRKENLRVNTDDSSPTQFHISSPVSMLESSSSSSSSSSIGKTMALGPSHRGPQRARSKRPRPATSNRRPAIQLVSPSSSSMETPKTCTDRRFSSESNSFTESPPIQKPEQKKPKKIMIASPAYPNTAHETLSSQTIRKCLHCQITKTPQWRAGPMGPKTLCNACGVRYKSGRLFPEYRPAASPTFVPSMHSNSHKKVLQMRSKLDPELVPTASLR